jgi:hypothetical protein
MSGIDSGVHADYEIKQNCPLAFAWKVSTKVCCMLSMPCLMRALVIRKPFLWNFYSDLPLPLPLCLWGRCVCLLVLRGGRKIRTPPSSSHLPKVSEAKGGGGGVIDLQYWR